MEGWKNGRLGGTLIKVFRRVWYGKDLAAPTYHICSALFLRMLGVVYLIAFVSLWTQIEGLIGQNGILPAQEFLDRVERYFAAQDPSASVAWSMPTLAWISTGNEFLHLLCAAGTALSVLLIVGWFPMPVLVLLWGSYLSLVHVGQDFLSFQWDILLLETGCVAIFMAPLGRLRSGFAANRHPSRLAIWLVWWLLFRLMFESGVVKLTWNEWQLGSDGMPVANTWESLTAMNFHYWTQPLPIWTSWYADKLPTWFQQLSVICVLIIEIGVPFLIFGPRLLRYVAFSAIALLMVLIAGTGNYNFFNLLTFVLALTLLDDHAWPRFIKNRISEEDCLPLTFRSRWSGLVAVPIFGLALLLGAVQLKTALLPPQQPQPSLASKLNFAQFFLVNDYGLFRKMTETRPEIVVEGSVDGTNWKPYLFRWKPGDVSQPPRFNTPHQPRLDWQMWFEALHLERAHEITGTIDPRHMSPWFQAFLIRLAQQEPAVLKLLRQDPFVDTPPKFIRISLFQYRFTTMQEKRESGHWWHRDLVWLGPGWSLEQ